MGWFAKPDAPPEAAKLVLLHLKMDGAPSLKGLLVGVWDEHYHLVRAKLVQEAGETDVDGVLEVPVANVLFVQTLERGVEAA